MLRVTPILVVVMLVLAGCGTDDQSAVSSLVVVPAVDVVLDRFRGRAVPSEDIDGTTANA